MAVDLMIKRTCRIVLDRSVLPGRETLPRTLLFTIATGKFPTNILLISRFSLVSPSGTYFTFFVADFFLFVFCSVSCCGGSASASKSESVSATAFSCSGL